MTSQVMLDIVQRVSAAPVILSALANLAFTECHGATIPSNHYYLRTGSYGTTDRGTGGALYHYSAAVDATYRSTHPRTSFIAADGRGFKLAAGSQWISPLMLGGTMDENFTVDQTAIALEYWAWYDENPNAKLDAQWDAGISATVTIGPSSAPNPAKNRTIVGQHRLRMISGSAAAHCIVKVRNMARVLWNGSIHGEGPGNAITFVQRQNFAVGVEFENCDRMRITGNSRGDRVWFTGILAARPNNNLLSLSAICSDCASGHDMADGSEVPGSHSLIGNWSLPSNSGSASNVGQRTTLTLTAFPPNGVNAPDYCVPTESLYQLRLVGDTRLYKVTAWDPAAGTVQVYPWIDSALGASGTYEWVFGGGLGNRSGDGQITLEKGTFLSCGSAIWTSAQYAGHYHNFTATACGYGLRAGREQGGSVLSGLEATGAYFEGNRVDLAFSDTPGEFTYGYVNSETNLYRDKIQETGQPRDGSNNVSSIWQNRDGKWDVRVRGHQLFQQSVDDRSGATYTLELMDRGACRRMTEAGASIAVTVPPNTFVKGDKGDLICAGSGSTLTIVAGAGVTLNSPDGLGPFRQNSRVHWQQTVETDTFNIAVVSGGIGNRGVTTVGDASVVLTQASEDTQRFDTAITADRTVTLPAPGVERRRFRVVRTAGATGAFNLTVQTSAAVALKVLNAASMWADVEDDGTEYRLTAAGSL